MNPSRFLNDLSRLLFPHTCIGCGNEVFQRDQFLCHRCFRELPVTNFHNADHNYTAMLFAGRLPLRKANSWLFYGKDGISQKMIHQLKYKGNKDIGKYLGRIMANQLMANGWLKEIDLLIPLPLNKRKLLSRGFNQSKIICEGMSGVSGLPIEEVAVMRTVNTQTQTRKSRMQRWRNVAEVFDLLDTSHLQGKHALLVDDVITTGATMEACGRVLLNVPGLTLSVLSVAVASRL